MSSKRRIRRNSCDGKVQHKNVEEAKKTLYRMLQQSPIDSYINVYKCKFCKQYHLGKAPDWKSKERL
jgi:hypothetical protein